MLGDVVGEGERRHDRADGRQLEGVRVPAQALLRLGRGAARRRQQLGQHHVALVVHDLRVEEVKHLGQVLNVRQHG